MEQIEHYVQDACEILVVARLQRLSEEDQGRHHDRSSVLEAAFAEYLASRGITTAHHSHEKLRPYFDSVEIHVPHFYQRLRTRFPDCVFEFEDIEKESRDRGKKADLRIRDDATGRSVDVSVKNYRGGIRRVQVASGTYNSFAMNLLFEPGGSVGRYTNPATSRAFRGADRRERKEQVAAAYGSQAGRLTEILEELDALNEKTRSALIDDPRFEVLTPGGAAEVKELAVNTGRTAVGLTLELMDTAPRASAEHLVKRVGLDTEEHIFFLGPDTCLSSVTVSDSFAQERSRGPVSVTWSRSHSGQAICLTFTDSGEKRLQAEIPFTINKNGAWFSEEVGRWHAKEGIFLKPGQRRPRKSRELATSVNTYLDLTDLSGVARCK